MPVSIAETLAFGENIDESDISSNSTNNNTGDSSVLFQTASMSQRHRRSRSQSGLDVKFNLPSDGHNVVGGSNEEEKISGILRSGSLTDRKSNIYNSMSSVIPTSSDDNRNSKSKSKSKSKSERHRQRRERCKNRRCEKKSDLINSLIMRRDRQFLQRIEFCFIKIN